MAAVFDVISFFFKQAAEGVAFALAVEAAVGRLVAVVGRAGVDGVAARVGEEGWVHAREVVLVNLAWVVAVLGVEDFFKAVVHGIDRRFASFVALARDQILALAK